MPRPRSNSENHSHPITKGHARGQGHAHSHSHSHPHPHFGKPNTSFKLAIGLNVAIVALEFVYGVLGHSVALAADAGHNLTDVLALILAWGSRVLAERKPTKHRTYGYRRTTILASLLNAIVLLVATGGILFEAGHRLLAPEPSDGLTVAWVAGLSILLNGFSAWLFSSESHDLNVRAAFLHMLSDAAISAGVLITGLLTYWTGIVWLDPLMSIAISIVITFGTWSLLRQSFNLAADAVPEGVDPIEIRNYFESNPYVVELHDLHVWGMSTTESILTAHLVVRQGAPALVPQMNEQLLDRFGIAHATIQIEPEDGSPCHLAPDTEI